MNRPCSLPTRPARTSVALAAVVLAACTSIPGESLVSWGQQREVSDRVLFMARGSDPQCKSPKIVHTEILDVHGDGRSAEEQWTVDQCGRRVNYLVAFPFRRGTGFSVRPEQ